MPTIYQVTAYHRTLAPEGKTFQVTVEEEPKGRFSARARGFGCSKEYSSAQRALWALMEDHAYTILRLVELPPTS